mgnify:CR=1 FL=1
MKKIFILSILSFVLACNTYKDLPDKGTKMKYSTLRIPSSPQQEDGNAEMGLNYLIYGDYIGSGIPVEMMSKRFGQGKRDTVFNRDGFNEKVAYLANVFEAPNGVMVSNGNCFTCHASAFNGEIVIGLGNSSSYYRNSLVRLSKSVS